MARRKGDCLSVKVKASEAKAENFGGEACGQFPIPRLQLMDAKRLGISR